MFFEFADAEVAHCHYTPDPHAQGLGTLTVRLAAARVLPSARSSDAQWMPVTLTAHSVPAAQGSVLQVLGRLHDGLVLRPGGQRLRQLPLPWDSTQLEGYAPLRLQLEWAHGQRWETEATAITLQPDVQCAVGAYQC